MSEVAAEPSTSRIQDAVRLLLLIDGAAMDLEAVPEDAPPGSVAVLRSQVMLQKLDFWLRNPDYYANMLLDRYDVSGNIWFLEEARRVMGSDEPEVRRYPMLRYLFGAYEPLDDALAVLASVGLVYRRREGDAGRTRVHLYYLTAKGREVAKHIVEKEPDLQYYVVRTRSVLAATDGQTGSNLKDEQYRQPEYASTPYNERIGSIVERVRVRLDTYKVARTS